MQTYIKMVADSLAQYMHKGTCDVYELIESEDGGITSTNWEKVAGNIACHLSFNKAESTTQTDTVNVDNKSATLFVATDVKIKKGSKVYIQQHGAEYTFYATGEPSVYPTHIEIGVSVELKA